MKKITYLLILLIAASTAGCEKEIPFDPENARTRIVMYSFLYPGELLQVELTKSQNILINTNGGDYPPVEGATIKVYKDGVFAGEMQEDLVNNNGNYYLFETVEAGASYRFEVEHPELEGVRSFTRMPESEPTFTATLVDTSSIEWILEIEVQDDPGEDYFVLDLIWESQAGGTSPEPIWFASTDPFLQTPESYYDPTDPNEYFDGEAYFTDEHFADGTYRFRVKMYADWWTVQDKTHIRVRLKSLTRDYYLFRYSSLLQQWNNGDPFAQPALIHNNVENGMGCVGSLNPGMQRVEI